MRAAPSVFFPQHPRRSWHSNRFIQSAFSSINASFPSQKSQIITVHLAHLAQRMYRYGRFRQKLQNIGKNRMERFQQSRWDLPGMKLTAVVIFAFYFDHLTLGTLGINADWEPNISPLSRRHRLKNEETALLLFFTIVQVGSHWRRALYIYLFIRYLEIKFVWCVFSLFRANVWGLTLVFCSYFWRQILHFYEFTP